MASLLYFNKALFQKAVLVLLTLYILLGLISEHEQDDNVSDNIEEVTSLQQLGENLSLIKDDDPGLLKYLRNQKIDYPDYTVKRLIGEPTLGQVDNWYYASIIPNFFKLTFSRLDKLKRFLDTSNTRPMEYSLRLVLMMGKR